MKNAHISADGKYRYFLSRILGCGPITTFIMLNPSTADAEVDDATIRKCLGFCQRWGCGTLQVINLFAIRTPHPAAMKQVEDPVGPDNKQAFDQAMTHAQQLGELHH